MPMQKPYRMRASESGLATFNYVDVASGIGFLSYYGTVTQDDVQGKEYVLTPNVVYSAVRDTYRTSAGTTTMNFDTSAFNLPRVAKGTAILSFGATFRAGSNVGEYISAQLQKVTATGSTVNLSATMTAYANLLYSNPFDSMMLFKLPLTQTIIKKGESIRLVLTISTDDTGTPPYVGIGHDPKGISGTYVTSTSTRTTQLLLDMPFRIDL